MEQKVKAVFAAHPDGQETAARIARAYLAAGRGGLGGRLDGLEEDQALAVEKGMSHLLYFHDAEHITMVSLMDEMGGFTVDILVSDLQLPQ